MQAATRIFEVVRMGGGRVVVTPKRNLSEFDFLEIEDELLALAGDQSVERVIVDFHRTDYLGSSALGRLVWLDQTLRGRGGRLAFCNVSAHQKEIVGVVGLATKWPTYATLQDALVAVAA